jgi:hypothetical protein
LYEGKNWINSDEAAGIIKEWLLALFKYWSWWANASQRRCCPGLLSTLPNVA